jgi:hypothetical protein
MVSTDAFEWTGQSSGHLVATVGRLPAGNFGEVLGSAAPKPCNRSRRAAARSEARTRAALTSESRIRQLSITHYQRRQAEYNEVRPEY